MLREGDLWSYLGLVRTFKMKWTDLIHTRRDLEIQIRVGGYLYVGMDEIGI